MSESNRMVAAADVGTECVKALVMDARIETLVESLHEVSLSRCPVSRDLAPDALHAQLAT